MTIREKLEELPEPHRTRAIAVIEKYSYENALQKEAESLTDALDCFIHQQRFERDAPDAEQNYWWDVYKWAEWKDSQYPEPHLPTLKEEV